MPHAFQKTQTINVSANTSDTAVHTGHLRRQPFNFLITRYVLSFFDETICQQLLLFSFYHRLNRCRAVDLCTTRAFTGELHLFQIILCGTFMRLWCNSLCWQSTVLESLKTQSDTTAEVLSYLKWLATDAKTLTTWSLLRSWWWDIVVSSIWISWWNLRFDRRPN